MSCWHPYCAVGAHIVLLASKLCCQRPYCAVGIHIVLLTSTYIVLLASLLMLVLLLASLYYFWYPCCYGSPFWNWRCDVPSVADSGCLSRIPDPDFYPSWIPDPKTATKEGGEKISLLEKPPSMCICSPSRASSRTRLLRSLHANAGVPLTLLCFAQLAKRKV